MDRNICTVRNKFHHILYAAGRVGYVVQVDFSMGISKSLITGLQQSMGYGYFFEGLPVPSSITNITEIGFSFSRV